MSSLEPLRSHLDQARRLIRDGLSWSPYDFIRDISLEGDRQLYIDQLTRRLDEQNDLRYLYSANDCPRIAILAERLPWDSAFFGYGVAKLSAVMPPSAGPKDDSEYRAEALRGLLIEARAKGVKYLFATVDPRELSTLRALACLGFSLIESRLIHHRSLSDFEYPERYNVRLADSRDVESLQWTARTMANPYDRFHADPLVAGDADRLMDKWVEASVTEGFADATLVPAVANPTAFCTVKYHKEHWPEWQLGLGQPVLSAVSPDFKGWYRKLISEASYHLRDVGANHAFLVTQVTNSAVIRVWESLGYRHGRAEHVLRVIL